MSPPANAQNLFTDDMEAELGRIVSYQTQLEFPTIDDPALTGYLQRVGDRVAAGMPTGLKFHLYLMDFPEANAFALPGGHVYVARKLVAQFRSEEELAAVLAHEMGHVVAHQSAIEMSAAMRDVLKINILEPGEVFERYNEMLENWRRAKLKDHRTRESASQMQADRIAVEALARAGYRPTVLAEFFDRFAKTHGRKGNWLTDIFGTTSEDSKRLREMARESSSIPASCIGHPEQATSEHFKNWQETVLKYSGIGHGESLPGLTMRKKLNPTLRAELDQIRISPDGRYFLAQDENTITVFSRETYSPLFVIDAQAAREAHFSADSNEVSFYAAAVGISPRVEIWHIGDKTHDVFELNERHGCVQTALSPDGKTFACVTFSESGPGLVWGIGFALRVIRVEDQELIYENKRFFSGDFFSLLNIYLAYTSQQEVRVAQMEFSPNGKLLLIGRSGMAEAVDVTSGKPVPLDGNIKAVVHNSFAFVDDHRIIGMENSGTSMLVSYPGGQILADNLVTGGSRMTAAAKGDYVILRPVKDFAVGILSIKDNKIFLALKSAAVDIYGDELLRENLDGRLIVNQVEGGKMLKTVPMPDTILAGVRTTAASKDLKFVALSGKTRGGVWDLEKNERRFYLRGFNGAHFEKDDVAILQFPKTEAQKHAVIAAALKSGNQIENIRENDEEEGATRHLGAYNITLHPPSGPVGGRIPLEVRDLRSDKVLWSRTFNSGDIPAILLDNTSGSMVLLWSYDDESARNAMKQHPELMLHLKRSGDRKGSRYLELIDPGSGNVVSRALVDTGNGSFHVEHVYCSSSRLFVSDDQQRILVYTLSGERIGRLLGHSAWLSPDGKWLAVRTGRGRLTIYNAENLEKRDQLEFSNQVSTLWYGDSGSDLLVLTSDQSVFRFDVNQLGRSNSSQAVGGGTASKN